MTKIKEKKEIPLYFDLLFKKIFADKHKLNPSRTLIKRTLNIEPKEIEVLNNELICRPYKDKKNEVDLIFEIDDGIKINYEINTEVDQSIINRNVRFLCLNISKDLKPEEKYKDIKSQKQINFDLKGHHNEPIEVYSLIDEKSGKILTDMLQIVRYDVPYFKELCYTTDINKLDGLSRLIGLFGANNIREVEYICKGDEELEEIMKQYKKYNDLEDVIGAYDWELHQSELARVAREQAVEAAIEETTEKVTKEVTKEVTEQSKIEIAKNMLKKGSTIEFISEVTGLDIDTIMGLQ